MPNLIDASSIIYAWDNYPIKTFPPLWGKWLASEIQHGEIQIARGNYGEVKGKSPDCYEWLSKNSIAVVSPNDPITQKANKIKRSLGITDDQYHPKGVDENDIYLIATGFEKGMAVISQEGEQFDLSAIKEMKKYKIPAVCKLHSVQHFNFLEFLIASN